MKITEIIVHAGQGFNHPYEQFANFKPSVSLKAVLEDGEDPSLVVKQLQAKAEGMVEDHKNHILSTLRELHHLSVNEQRAADLSRKIAQAQRELDEIRQHPKGLPEGEEEADLFTRQG